MACKPETTKDPSLQRRLDFHKSDFRIWDLQAIHEWTSTGLRTIIFRATLSGVPAWSLGSADHFAPASAQVRMASELPTPTGSWLELWGTIADLSTMSIWINLMDTAKIENIFINYNDNP